MQHSQEHIKGADHAIWKLVWKQLDLYCRCEGNNHNFTVLYLSCVAAIDCMVAANWCLYFFRFILVQNMQPACFTGANIRPLLGQRFKYEVQTMPAKYTYIKVNVLPLTFCTIRPHYDLFKTSHRHPSGLTWEITLLWWYFIHSVFCLHYLCRCTPVPQAKYISN